MKYLVTYCRKSKILGNFNDHLSRDFTTERGALLFFDWLERQPDVVESSISLHEINQHLPSLNQPPRFRPWGYFLFKNPVSSQQVQALTDTAMQKVVVIFGITSTGNDCMLYPIYIPPLRVGNLKYIISKDKSSNIDIRIHIMYYIKTITKEIDQ